MCNCTTLMASPVFCPLLQMADCGGMPQVDQVCTQRCFFFSGCCLCCRAGWIISDEGQVGGWYKKFRGKSISERWT